MNNAAENFLLLGIFQCMRRKVYATFCKFGKVGGVVACRDKGVSILRGEPHRKSPRTPLGASELNVTRARIKCPMPAFHEKLGANCVK